VLIPRPALAQLAAALAGPRAGLRTAETETDLDPLDLVRAGAAAFGSAVYFSSPAGRALGGLGLAWSAEAAGPGRFSLLDGALGCLVAGGMPAALGFAFAPGGPRSPEWDGFPAATVVVPKVAVWRQDGRSWLHLAVPAGEGPEPVLETAGALRRPGPPAVPAGAGPAQPLPPLREWAARVAEAVATVRSGMPAKVVLARARRVPLERAARPFDVVAALRDRSPGCHAYGWQRGTAALVGASPELLVARVGRRFEARPLAGSARRGTGPEEDRRLGDALLADPKERAEHAFVVEEVCTHLAPLADTLHRPPAPRLERLPTVQHLATSIVGTTGARLLALVDALHPTAAVAGVPRPEALAQIEAMEGLDRGWYAGGVGWGEPGGNGEAAVALRCALLRGKEALVYAGAGIVAGSDPASEAAETELKMRPLLELFGEVA
jgi:menaquinone-specific isochorismate synthase